MRYLTMYLAAALLTLLTTLPSRAASEMTQLTPDNFTKQDAFHFTITAEQRDDGIHITVTISPTPNGRLSSILESSLAIMDGKQPIASCDVAPDRTDKSVTYRFVVAEKYLDQSTFEFGNMAVSNGIPMPAGDFYWFYLKDVANLK